MTFAATKLEEWKNARALDGSGNWKYTKCNPNDQIENNSMTSGALK